MGRIISFAAPAYHSVSRAASPESSDEDTRTCSASYSPGAMSRPSVGLGKGCDEHYAANRYKSQAKSRNGKHVQFSDAPPVVCEIPDWDRSPWLPSPEDLAQQGEEEDELLASETPSDATGSDEEDQAQDSDLSPQTSPQQWTHGALPACLTSDAKAQEPRSSGPGTFKASNTSAHTAAGRRQSEGGILLQPNSRHDAQVLQASLTTRRHSKSRDLTLEAATRWARRLSI